MKDIFCNKLSTSNCLIADLYRSGFVLYGKSYDVADCCFSEQHFSCKILFHFFLSLLSRWLQKRRGRLWKKQNPMENAHVQVLTSALQWGCTCLTLTVLLARHLCRWSQHGNVYFLWLQWETLRLIPDLGPFKIRKEELMSARSHRCQQSDIREHTVGEGWWHYVALVMSSCGGAGPLPPAPWGSDPGQVWCSAEAL